MGKLHSKERWHRLARYQLRKEPLCVMCLAEWLQGYTQAGTTHLMLRFAGDHERHLDTVAALRSKLAC